MEVTHGSPIFLTHAFMVVYVLASHHRLKSLKHALFNVYLESFLGLVDTFIRSTDAQLVVSY